MPSGKRDGQLVVSIAVTEVTIVGRCAAIAVAGLTVACLGASGCVLDPCWRLSQRVVQLHAEGKYQESIPYAEKALRAAERGFRSYNVAVSLYNLGASYLNVGRYAEAEPLFQRALAIWEGLDARTDPNFAATLNNLGLLYYLQGRYAEAEPLFQRALAIWEGLDARTDPGFATTLHNLALLYIDQGRYAEAEPLCERALRIREASLGPGNISVAPTLNNLALVYTNQRRYGEAEPLFQRALAIWEGLHVGTNPNFAQTLNNLGLLYYRQVRYVEAEPLYLRALAMKESIFGPNHLEVALTLYNLALLYTYQGRYAEAEPLCERALPIREASLGARHIDVARTLSSLAVLYTIEGRYLPAEPFCRRAIAIYEQAGHTGDLELGTSLNNLALLLFCQGRHAEAEQLYQRAVAVVERAGGTMHLNLASPFTGLGEIYRKQGRYAEAESYAKRALAVQEQSLGPAHPDVSRTLNNLALLYREQGRDAEAGPLLEQATRIAEQALGPVHVRVGRRLASLATLHAGEARVAKASQCFDRASRIFHQHTWPVASYLAQPEQERYLSMWRPHLEEAFSLCLLPQADRAVDRLACAWSLNGKEIGAEVLAQRQLALRQSDDPRIRKLLGDLMTIRSELARQMLQSSKPQLQLQEREQELAEALARAGHSQSNTMPRWVTPEDACAALTPRAALLEVVQIRRYDFKDPKDPWREPRYLCFVLTAAKTDSVTRVDLGEAKIIDDAVGAYRSSMEAAGEATDKGWSAISSDEVAHRGRVLAKLLWEPLREHVKDVDHLLISPDGQLCLLPWEVLPVEGDKFLVEQKRISYAGAGRDVVAFADQPSKPSSAVVFADPDFDLLPEARAQAVRQLLPAVVEAGTATQASDALALRCGSRRSRDFGAMHFDSLPGFGAEAKAIVEPLTKLTGQRPKVYAQAQALEGVFKQVRRPGVLTVHTHGWFLEDQDWSAGGTERGLSWDFRDVGGIGPQYLFAGAARIENPLLRCGLALSGANVGARPSEQSNPDLDDGILTGMEIVGIDLTGTELVVLSACQTGVGEVKIGEGVYGLRRAFHLAGAKSLLVSLWRVPDEPTQALMTSFFTHWASGMSKVDALRAAQRGVMAMTFEIETERGVAGISGQRAKVTVSGRHPYFWAGFILVGDWR